MDINSSDLSARLRVETQALHVEAERSGYVREILKRRASLEGYALYLRNLQPVYRDLERALGERAMHPVIDLFSWAELFRSDTMASDLTALAGPSWEEILPMLAAAHAYAGRIAEVARSEPARLIGHAYVRYIGDLSGGQIVRSLLSTSPGLAPDMLRFYDFSEIGDVERYKEMFRATLDRAGALADGVDAIVDEAKQAFRFNIGLSLAVHQSMTAGDRQI